MHFCVRGIVANATEVAARRNSDVSNSTFAQISASAVMMESPGNLGTVQNDNRVMNTIFCF